jgi:hypothetical protein
MFKWFGTLILYCLSQSWFVTCNKFVGLFVTLKWNCDIIHFIVWGEGSDRVKLGDIQINIMLTFMGKVLLASYVKLLKHWSWCIKLHYKITSKFEGVMYTSLFNCLNIVIDIKQACRPWSPTLFGIHSGMMSCCTTLDHCMKGW